MLIYQWIIVAVLGLFRGLVARNLRDYATLAPDALPPNPGEKLFVLIPARNEAANIGGCLAGLLAQRWGDFQILVLDDASDDGTAEIVAEIAARDLRVKLLPGRPIEAGWAGKVWACTQLGEAVLEQGADRLLFLDADTRAKPDLIGPALAYAQTTGAGMVSTFPYQVTQTVSEKIVLPMLHFLILTFLPIRGVWEQPFPQLVAACGQFELFSAEAYRTIGGHRAIPNSFHDGLQLARRAKAAGQTVRLYDGSPEIACHMYTGFREVWRGFTRNAYEGLGGVVPLLVMTLLQTTLFLLPFGFLIAGLNRLEAWAAPCLLQVGLIYQIRWAQAKRFGHKDSVWLHPVSVLALLVIQWASFFKSLTKRPTAWKGRVYSG